MTEEDRGNIEKIKDITSKFTCELGGEVFLGRRFREAKILHLGLNPGVPSWKKEELKEKGSLTFETDLWDFDPLLEEDPSGEKIGDKYWKNARIFFNANPTLKAEMKKAVFSFLIPWRSKDFASLEARADYQEIKEESLSLLEKIIGIVEPDIILFSGKKCAQIFWREFLNKNLDTNWEEHNGKMIINRNHFFRVFTDNYLSTSTFVVLNHFSRTGNRINPPYEKGNLEVLAESLSKKLFTSPKSQ
jgi:hypothetical protein